MKSNIDDLCDAFIAAITDVGYAPKNIENYKQVSNRFKKFCVLENPWALKITQPIPYITKNSMIVTRSKKLF